MAVINLEQAIRCGICYEPYGPKEKRPTISTSCAHTFCQACIRRVMDSPCPNCRVVIKGSRFNYGLEDTLPAIAAVIAENRRLKEALAAPLGSPAHLHAVQQKQEALLALMASYGKSYRDWRCKEIPQESLWFYSIHEVSVDRRKRHASLVKEYEKLTAAFAECKTAWKVYLSAKKLTNDGEAKIAALQAQIDSDFAHWERPTIKIEAPHRHNVLIDF